MHDISVVFCVIVLIWFGSVSVSLVSSEQERFSIYFLTVVITYVGILEWTGIVHKALLQLFLTVHMGL